MTGASAGGVRMLRGNFWRVTLYWVFGCCASSCPSPGRRCWCCSTNSPPDLLSHQSAPVTSSASTTAQVGLKKACTLMSRCLDLRKALSAVNLAAALQPAPGQVAGETQNSPDASMSKLTGHKQLGQIKLSQPQQHN